MSSGEQRVTDLKGLQRQLDGEVRDDRLHQMLYAQDASVYQEQPQAVAFPRHRRDVEAIVGAADSLGMAITPRAGGTSLAGQTTGSGLVVDVGRYMNDILEVNEEEGWVRVQPGVILEDLNRHLKQYDLFFGPDTSTANRCMIGGMIGNNSCGSHSIYYGTTRDHVLELGVVLSDGEYVEISPWDAEELKERMEEEGRLAEGVRTLDRIAGEHGELIEEKYPRPDLIRRNTGYPLDDIVGRSPYGDGGPFSLPRFLCGTEGTLGLVVEAKLNLVERPKESLLVCVHFRDLESALRATVEAVKHDAAAVELMDRRILERTKNNIEQAKNRFWVEGDPSAVLAVEFYRDTGEELQRAADELIEQFERQGMGYAYPIVRPPKDKAVWDLRKAGLGLLMGIEGDTKPVTVVEDTAVAVDVLPDYIRDFSGIMDAYGTACVYYAHASVGLLHLRPELNLKDPEDVDRFEGIAEEVTDLVARYRGALSGEHGDGRVRSPLLERFFGPEVMELHREVKTAFDPKGIFNPGKIVDPKPIDEGFRFEVGEEVPQVDTYFRWEKEQGLVRATELCNGAGVCRKRAGAGGTMCPSYMATLEEKDSTRGRANTFRSLLTRGDEPEEAFTSDELGEALDLCLSCKGCKTECPASVDMAKMKAEYLQQRYDREGVAMSARLFGNFGRLARLGSWFPRLTNFMLSLWLTKWILSAWFGVSRQRTLPQMATKSFGRQFRDYRRDNGEPEGDRAVWLYIDPFTDFTEPEIGMAAVRVLEAAGYRVERFGMRDDGRTYLSKGLVKKGRGVLERGLAEVADDLENHPGRAVVGLEPSALLTFRDEMSDLVGEQYRQTAARLEERAFLLEEFLVQEMEAGHVDPDLFAGEGTAVLHGHCHQKALVGTEPTERLLEAAGFEVQTLPTGCCGMAGSFGYEKEHYELSMKVGELVLFPEVRSAAPGTIIAAPGTSCRHHILDGTGKKSIHPVEILHDALRPETEYK